jgi:hypothetical protein
MQRNLCVRAGFTMFVAITFPFFSALLSSFGGFAVPPTTYFVSSYYRSSTFAPLSLSSLFLSCYDVFFSWNFIIVKIYLHSSCSSTS